MILILNCCGISYAEGTVSLQVTDGEVRDVLMALARSNQVNILVDDSVTGKITTKIENVDFDTALQLIVQMKDLQYQKIDGIFIVSKQGKDGQHFGSLHVYPLEYIGKEQAERTALLALGSGLEYEKNMKRISFDEVRHTLLFYGTDNEARQIEKSLKTMDISPKQVSLEAKVLSIDKDAAKNLGVEWEWSKLPQSPDHELTTETTTTTVWNSNTNSNETVTQTVPVTRIERTWKNGSEGIPGIISFGRNVDGYPFEMYYAAKLNALFSNGKAEILAKPNVMTADGKEAVINIGGSVPVPVVSTTNVATTTTIEYHDVGIILKYIPRIHQDGEITADVHMEVSTPVYVADLKAYRFNRRAVDTVVRLKDGETMVVGGLIGSEENQSLSKIPFLSDLPILGRLFRNSSKSKTESEVMIFLTANIVK